MNAAQKIDAAMLRVEDASANLDHAALHYAKAEPGTWDRLQGKKELRLWARRYANAMRNLQRVNRTA